MTELSPEQIRVAIADDEELARAHIRRLLAAAGPYPIVADSATGHAAVDALRHEQPDVLFLDIQMPGRSGFEVLQDLGDRVPPVVVFTTAYDEYALHAFDVCAVDYLLKPITDERFTETLRRAHQTLRRVRMEGNHQHLRKLLHKASRLFVGDGDPTTRAALGTRRLAIRTRDRVLLVQPGDIDWIEAAGDYVKVHTGTRTHLQRGTMQEMEGLLDPTHFVRIHRSTIVNAERVVEMQPYFHGELVVLLRDGTKLRMSRGHRANALAALGIE